MWRRCCLRKIQWPWLRHCVREPQINWVAFSILCACDQLRYYLTGRSFCVETELLHLLKWVLNYKKPGKLARCALLLQEFEFTIIPKPGKANANADALSRLPTVSTVSKNQPRKKSTRATPVTCGRLRLSWKSMKLSYLRWRNCVNFKGSTLFSSMCFFDSKVTPTPLRMSPRCYLWWYLFSVPEYGFVGLIE
jgi:hypothetical protein